MPDSIGNITVPAITPSGTFPITSEYPWGRALKPEVHVHRFGAANDKIEQRFLVGTGAKLFRVRCSALSEARREALRDFWENNSGAYGAFTYNAPNDNNLGTTAYTVHFADQSITFDFLLQALSSSGVTLVEIPSSAPSYTVNSTVTRFPSPSLESELLSQAQVIIPLVKITVREPNYPAIYVSDRRCTVGGQLYQARLLDFDGISQGIGGEADEASFVFGNADRVMRDLANDTDLFRASLEFSLFHVGTGIKLDLWKGDVINWALDAGPEFRVTAADGLYELNLPYPTRRITRSCWKDFNNGTSCPAATAGGTNLQTPCDKGFDTAEGCVFHTMQSYFGGIIAKPQAVRTKDNSSGTWGYGRSALTSVSLVADSIYDQVVPEIYTDTSMPVNAKIAAGRDEGDFYCALGIVGEGPIGAFGTGHKLDGQAHHGPGNLGLRLSRGHDPAQDLDPDKDSDKFSLGQGGAGIQWYGAERVAGTAFIEIRRSDPKGLQLSRLGEHAIQVNISQGLSGWVWTAPGVRTTQILTNPVWIVINTLLRARGLRFADAATCEQYFDVNAAIAAASICNQMVNRLVGSGTETQFKFRGILQEEKPLRDWIQEILMNCLGYYTFAFGKLKLGIRNNSSSLEAFSAGNILFRSLRLAPLKPAFNHLTANFADEEFDYVGNSISLYDMDHAKLAGGAASPLFLKSSMNLSGTSSKSQAARLISVRLREELGGITAAEWKRARLVTFRSTVLALNVEPGMVCSMTHYDMPGGYGEFRVAGWRLNKDYSIDIEGRTTTDSMYDLISGPKPADVTADPLPVESNFAPGDWNFDVETDGDGVLYLKNFTCKTNAEAVDRFVAEIYYHPEDETGYTSIDDQMLADENDDTMGYAYEPLKDGDWVLVDDELMYVKSITPSGTGQGTAKVLRGSRVFNDPANAAQAHTTINTTVQAVDSASNAVLTLETGLNLRPGMILFTLPAGAWAYISEYDPATGKCTVCLPYDDVSVGMSMFADARLWRVTMKRVVREVGASFLRSADRSRFSVDMPLPFAGVVAVRGYLETRFGVRSNVLLKLFTFTAKRIRTGGTTQYLMNHPSAPAGVIQDAFERLRAETTQSFEKAWAVKKGGATNAIPPPRAVATAGPSAYQYGGTITIGGAPAVGDEIAISIGNPADEAMFLRIPRYTVNAVDGITPAQIAVALTNWLNGTEEFWAFYAADAPSGAEVRIVDKTGVNGEITVDVRGTVTAVASGVTSNLGTLSGRRYALTWADSVQGYESEPGPLCYSTGPTGGATRIEISDLPRTSDVPGVDTLNVYATPDGQENPLHLVASVALGTGGIADTLTEAQLAAQPAYAGPVQPSAPGAVKVTVKKDGGPWFELRIDADRSVSNVIDGLALNNVAQGSEITADVDNQAEAVDLMVVLQ